MSKLLFVLYISLLIQRFAKYYIKGLLPKTRLIHADTSNSTQNLEQI